MPRKKPDRNNYNGPRMTVKRDAYGMTVDVAGKRESIVIDQCEEHGTRVFVFDKFGNELIVHQLK
jgi:hypothetical protein